LQATLKQSAAHHHWLQWAIVCSMLVHVGLVLVVPNFSFEPLKAAKQELKIELVQEKQPEPEPEVIPEPPKPVEPEPIKPEPIVKQIKPEPIKKPLEKIQPTQPTEPSKEVAPPPVQPDVIKVAPSAESKPVETVPTPPPPQPEPKKTGPSDADIDAARNAYRNQVAKELKRNQRYPKIAETRGIEGEVKLEISIDQEGNVIDVQVAESSGNDSLDKAAIDAVKRSNLKQYMQDILRGHVDKITVTVGFKIAS
jgi:periplasmic protein TonB